MHYRQMDFDGYRVYVGAVEAEADELAGAAAGYQAALIVSRPGAAGRRELEAYRDDSLGCGYRWSSADEALSYALTRSREMIRKRSPALRC